jgi:hypothetical protein
MLKFVLSQCCLSCQHMNNLMGFIHTGNYSTYPIQASDINVNFLGPKLRTKLQFYWKSNARQGQECLLLYIIQTGSGPTQSPIQWVWRALFLEKSTWCVGMATYLKLVPTS